VSGGGEPPASLLIIPKCAFEPSDPKSAGASGKHRVAREKVERKHWGITPVSV
jgi:hypothetical protein